MFFFFNDTATTEIYTLSLHDALPISRKNNKKLIVNKIIKRKSKTGYTSEKTIYTCENCSNCVYKSKCIKGDRKSTRLNSSHANISYAVFCLKKKKTSNIKPIIISKSP